MRSSDLDRDAAYNVTRSLLDNAQRFIRRAEELQQEELRKKKLKEQKEKEEKLHETTTIT